MESSHWVTMLHSVTS